MDDLKRLEEIEKFFATLSNGNIRSRTDWLIFRLRAALKLPEDAEKVVLSARAAVEHLTSGVQLGNKRMAINRALSLLAPALARVKELEGQISHVDAVLARRPALDDCPDRLSKIEKCISTAKKADADEARVAELEAENAKILKALKGIVDDLDSQNSCLHNREWWGIEPTCIKEVRKALAALTVTPKSPSA